MLMVCKWTCAIHSTWAYMINIYMSPYNSILHCLQQEMSVGPIKYSTTGI